MTDPGTNRKIVGCNIPEFHEALSNAAMGALGYWWCSVVIWRDEDKRDKFMCVKKEDGKPKYEGNWKKVMTVIPYVYER